MGRFDEKTGRFLDSKADYYKLASNVLERYEKTANNCDMLMVGVAVSTVSMMERGLANKTITKDQFKDMSDKIKLINYDVKKNCICHRK